jgi:hypothetical protein
MAVLYDLESGRLPRLLATSEPRTLLVPELCDKQNPHKLPNMHPPSTTTPFISYFLEPSFKKTCPLALNSCTKYEIEESRSPLCL